MVNEALTVAKIVQWELWNGANPTWAMESATTRKWNSAAGFLGGEHDLFGKPVPTFPDHAQK
jgi:hypothetical protein